MTDMPVYAAGDPSAEKKRLRPLCIERRASLDREEREAADSALRDALFSSALFRDATLLCLYYPMRDEPDILPVWRRGQALGKYIALPVCGEGHTLSYRLMPGYDASLLRPGAYGTTEPTEDCPPLPLHLMDGALLLVPGLSFDSAGYRLGYGGGYYDRLLGELAAEGISPVTVGVTYHALLAPGLPHLPHDLPVRYILTERGLCPTYAESNSTG